MNTTDYLKIFKNCTFWPIYVLRFDQVEHESITTTVMHMNLMSWVSGAFNWESTPERRQFWFEISEAWRQFIRSDQPNPLPYLDRWYEPPETPLISIY